MATQPIVPQPTGNPLLDNPALKAQLVASMQKPPAPQMQGAVMPPANGPEPVSVNLPIAAPSMPSTPSPKVNAPRGTSTGDEAELSRKLSTGSGISQISGKIENSGLGQAHPLLGKVLGIGAQGLAQLGDIGLKTFAPGLEANIPGTEGHHNMLVHRDQQQLGQDVANEEKQAQTRETNTLPALHQAQAALGAAKLGETQQHHQSQIEEQLHTHGYKTAEDGTIQPLAYGEMSEQQQAVHDLKASQEELADASSALKKVQADPNSPQARIAQQRIEGANQARQIALRRLGLSQQEFQANYYGTDTAGNALPGAPATATGQPEGIKVASLTKPGVTAQGKASQGRAVVESATDLKDFIDKNKGAFGNIDQYWQQYMNGTPIADPTASKAMAKIASFAALQPALHGFKSHDAMREFAKMIGGIPKNPEALKAAIDGLVESAATPMIHAGTMRTVDQGKPNQAPQRPPTVPEGYIWNPQGNGGKGSWQPPKQ
jgi:hypothetical protein